MSAYSIATRGLAGRKVPQGVLATMDPRTLFSASEQGAWYDPSDFSTMFQDSAGSTPVTAVGQPVGLLLDKSKGLVLGPELVTNPGGPFAATTGWSDQSGNAPLTVSGGNLVATPTSTGMSRTDAPIATVAGKWYTLTVNMVQFSGPGATLAVLQARNGSIVPGAPVSGTVGITTFKFLAVGSSVYLTFGSNVSVVGVANILSSATIKEIPGNHATQATATARPVLSARVNLLTKTGDLGVAPWFNPQGASSYVGGKIVPAATTLIHGRRYTRSQVAGRKVTVSAYVKAGEAGVNLEFWNYVSTGAVVNLTTWVVTDVTNCTVFLGDFDGDGYRMVSFTFTENTTTNNNTDFRVTRSTLRDQQFVGDGSSGYFLKKPQVEIGAVATTYQSVNTSTDYDADPSKFPAYLRFDGVDDAMHTGNIDFTATDKMTVVAGVRSNLNGYSNILELGPNSASENGFSLQRGFAANGDYAGIAYGTSLGYGFTSNFAAPDTSVIAAQYDIAQASVWGGEISFRRNGVVSAKASSQGSAGTGNFSQKPLYIGCRDASSLYFNGHLYSLIVRGAQTPLSQIETTELYTKQKMRLP